ncbi:hypothetical protein FGB62_154g112 [Gracilaria domingensis]|nr:hypothetical protein FGB62_154g112 [Gracilaria domingensis]
MATSPWKLLLWGQITVWKLTSPFTFTDVSGWILPKGMPRGGVVSIAKLGFDNDSDFDLYVARAKSGDLRWTPGDDIEDFLLENRNGKYVDVSRKAKLPRNTMSRGVTVADCNNDGYIDIFVT